MSVKKKPTVKKTAGEKSGQVVIKGTVDGLRVPSRVLEERLQEAVRGGARDVLVLANGQHGIGGRIWPTGEAVRVTVEGPVGQRMGSMGMEGTEVTVRGSASDDVGWVNCGARITVMGDVTNGAHNAAAQGVLYVQGGGGARCDTMTKHNPRFAPPQSWYFRDVGDSFAEFKAGGIAVVCGMEPRNPENVLGYRPCVGMVGGAIYFRGPIKGYSEGDVKLVELTPQDWEWLRENMLPFLKAIDREAGLKELTRSKDDWRKLIAYTPAEKAKKRAYPVAASEFRKQTWEKEVGKGGIFAPYITHDQTILPYITTGVDRRNRPLWANEKYQPPCAATCPSGIPSHKRSTLIRQGKTKEALELVLEYSPLPATVCGEICPNLCMQSCTRGLTDRPINIKEYGKLALELPAPKREKGTGLKIGIIGGGPAGLSAAWQLARRGHEVSVYESADKLGGKLELCIPRERLPQRILLKELSRFTEMGVKVHLGGKVDRQLFEKIHGENDKVVVACGAHKPRALKFQGSEHTVSAYDFLKGINLGTLPNSNMVGANVVVIGAGNVGMDVALQAFNCGAASVRAVDVQKPAAFGREMEMAREKGTEIIWPRSAERYEPAEKRIHFTDGTSMDADIVVVAIGEAPLLDFLTPEVHTERGFIAVDEKFQTSDPKVYAIGDATRPGLVTNAIGHGRLAAEVIHSELMHYDYMPEVRQQIPRERIKSEYYEVCHEEGAFRPEAEAQACMSCATCRDCHMCETTCYWGAISRRELPGGAYEYVVDPEKCIGCGFCAGVCPCGVWEMAENV